MYGRRLSPARKTVSGGLVLLVAALGLLGMPSVAYGAGGVPAEHPVSDEATLVQAIEAINANPDPDGDRIQILASAPTTITLNASLPAFNAAVSQNVEIVGATDPEGRLLVTLDGQAHASRVFGFLNPNGGSLQISQLSIVGARASAISVSGPGSVNLTVSGVDISGAQNSGINYAALGGNVAISDAVLSENEIGIAIDVAATTGNSPREVHVSDVTATENQLAGVQLGARAEDAGALDVTFESVTASDNLGNGFSVVTETHATPVFREVTAVRNAGDGFTIESGSGSHVTLERASVGENGNSGVWARTRGGANLTISETDIAANEGMAIDFIGTNGGKFLLRNSVVRDHLDPKSIGTVAAIAFSNTTGEAAVEGTSFLRNSLAGEALVLYCEEGGTISLVNSTVAQNTATDADAGALRVSNCATVTLTNVTVADNSGAGAILDYNDRTVLANSVFAGNSGFDVQRAGGSPFSVSHSLIQNPNAASGVAVQAGTGNIATGTDPLLEAPAYLGGPELGDDSLAFQTILPGQGSPVIDAGLDTLVPASATMDQRQADRISGAAVDMGAVETQAAPPEAPALDLTGQRSPQVVSEVGEEILFEFDIQNTGNVPLRDVTLQLSGFTGSGKLGATSCVPAVNPVLPADPDIVIHCTVPYRVLLADLTGSPIRLTGIASGTSPSDRLVWSPERTLTVDTVKAVVPPSGSMPNGENGTQLPNTGTPDPAWSIALAGGLLAAGAVVWLARRRQRLCRGDGAPMQ